MLKKNPELTKPFAEPPMAALRQGPNLRRKLCKSRLYPVPKGGTRGGATSRSSHTTSVGWKRCSRRHGMSKECPICPFTAPPTTEIVSPVNGYKHQIKDVVSCDTTNCIYHWRCKKGSKCKDYPYCQYNGQTQREFKKRFAEHRDYVMREVIEQPSGEHFNKPGHSVHDLEGLVIEKVHSKDPFVLKARESQIIRNFDSFRYGLNKEP